MDSDLHQEIALYIENAYELESSITEEIARADLADAKKFVAEITQWLNKEGWI